MSFVIYCKCNWFPQVLSNCCIKGCTATGFVCEWIEHQSSTAVVVLLHIDLTSLWAKVKSTSHSFQNATYNLFSLWLGKCYTDTNINKNPNNYNRDSALRARTPNKLHWVSVACCRIPLILICPVYGWKSKSRWLYRRNPKDATFWFKWIQIIIILNDLAFISNFISRSLDRIVWHGYIYFNDLRSLLQIFQQNLQAKRSIVCFLEM